MNRETVIILFIVVFLLIDYYAFQAVLALIKSIPLSSQKVIKWIYFSFTFLVVVCIVVYNFGPPDGIAKQLRPFLISFILINVLAKVLICLFLLVDDLQRGIRYLIYKLSNPKVERTTEGISRSKFLATSGLIVAAAPVISLSWGIISGAHDYRIRRVSLKIKNLPSALNGLRIGQISDIHSGSFWNKTAVKGGVEMMMNEQVDLAFFTGDLVNNRASEMSAWVDVFSKIKAPLGVYSVLGNHDYGDYVKWESQLAKKKNLKDLISIHKNMGWNLLLNEHRIVEVDGQKLGVVGVENWGAKARFPKYGKLDVAMQNMPETSINILLSHDPSHWQAQVVPEYKNIDLTLSGHTHGMQFGIEIPGFKWSPVQYVYDEWAGLYQYNNQSLYVNRGFGYIGYPGRFGILPEISIITLVSE